MGIFQKGALARHFDPLNITGKGEGKRFDIQNALMSFDVLDLAGDLKKAEAAKRYKEDVAGYNAEQQAKKATNVGQAQASNVGKRMKKGGKVSKEQVKKSKTRKYTCSHNRLY